MFFTLWDAEFPLDMVEKTELCWEIWLLTLVPCAHEKTTSLPWVSLLPLLGLVKVISKVGFPVAEKFKDW